MTAKKAKPKLPPQTAAIALALTLTVIFFGGWFSLWLGVRQHVLSSKDYLLTRQNVEITPPPPWILDDIREKVFSDASLDGPLSIMEPDLVKRIAEAFSMHPWVAKVRRVTKRYPAHISVELEYRRPVCVVEVVTNGEIELRPVDAEGVVLPQGDFAPVALSQYPRLVDARTTPVGMEGTPWGDPRVRGAAQIAAAFGEAWTQLGMDRIVALKTGEAAVSDACTYELVTRRGTRVVWGRSPEHPLANEFSTAEKIARLKQHATEHGSLDDLAQIDVRSLPSFRITPHSRPTGAGGP